MKRNILSVLLIIISPVVWADNEVTRVELGSPTLDVSQPLNEVFGQKTVTLPALCTKDCSDVTVKWEPLATRLTDVQTPPGVWLFDSGVKGIAIQIRTQPGKKPSAGQPVEFQVGLVRVTQEVAGGSVLLVRPLLQWGLFRQTKDGQTTQEKTGQIVVNGNLTAGSCVLKQNSLAFNLNTVTINEIKKTEPGKPVISSGDRQSIAVDCTPGIADLNVSFRAQTVNGNNTVIKATHENKGEAAGVGFIIENKEQAISWDGTPLTVKVPEDGHLVYPLTAYFTPTGAGIIDAGNINGIASFDINYQ
ncbi:type 1 fimbrial protein [Salmonella enterica]|nr:type 1 fimbrial protein [Salmonella enterica]EBW7255644.1 type 1 fimbrial protein [Salmonella enterica subsp. enterica serovar Gatow]HCM6306423.1 type 1 fimbrial protein [Salmonella enterica subsp. enterica serovar 6,14:y:1,7]